MMGAGKSTVGPRLAARLGRDFVDTDQEVEREAGLRISEIFEREGEARFRAREAQAIERAARANAVVALGGGAIAQPGMAEELLARGSVIFLRVEPSVLVERIGDAASRPLLAGLDADARRQRLAALLAERRVHYQKATITVDASRGPEEVVDEIMAALERSEGKPLPPQRAGQNA
jgi:shikimate kinase